MLIRFVTATALALALPAAVLAQDSPPEMEPPMTTRVVLETTMGDIVIALEIERAPITAGNFLRYVEEDRLDGTVFYRAMVLDWGEQPNGLIQGGAQNDWDRILDPIPHEPTNETGVLHEAGTISMAMGEPGTATGDFTILLQPIPQLNADPDNEDPTRRPGFAAFGHVVAGMDVVAAIHAAPIDPAKGEGWMVGQMLAQPVVIVDAQLVRGTP